MNVTIMEHRYDEHTARTTEIYFWENAKKFKTGFGMTYGFDVTVDDGECISLAWYNGIYLEIHSNISKTFKSDYFWNDFSEAISLNLCNAKSIIIKSDNNYHDNAEKSKIIIDVGDSKIIEP